MNTARLSPSRHSLTCLSCRVVAAVLCAQDKETFAHADAFESGTNPPDKKKRGRTSVTYTDGQLTHYNLRMYSSMLPINYLSGFLRAANEVKVQIDVFKDLGFPIPEEKDQIEREWAWVLKVEKHVKAGLNDLGQNPHYPTTRFPPIGMWMTDVRACPART